MKSFSNTPARSHSWNRRWHVCPEPNSGGIARHWQPVRNRYTMPPITARSSLRGRPRRERGAGGGISSFSFCHSGSGMVLNRLSMPARVRILNASALNSHRILRPVLSSGVSLRQGEHVVIAAHGSSRGRRGHVNERSLVLRPSRRRPTRARPRQLDWIGGLCCAPFGGPRVPWPRAGRDAPGRYSSRASRSVIPPRDGSRWSRSVGRDEPVAAGSVRHELRRPLADRGYV